jgi:hypothetical protein
MVSADEEVQEITTGGSQGHLEFSSTIVNVDNTVYISNNQAAAAQLERKRHHFARSYWGVDSADHSVTRWESNWLYSP